MFDIYWERDLFGLSSLLSQVPPDVIIGGGLYTLYSRTPEREREGVSNKEKHVVPKWPSKLVLLT